MSACSRGATSAGRGRSEIAVGFVQLNTQLDTSLYLPYSTGLLQAYLQKHSRRPERYGFTLPLVRRMSPGDAVAALAGVEIAGFSAYVWNCNRSLAVARALKAANPNALVVFGGPHVPDEAEEFLRANPFVDVACHGEGEQTFFDIAERYPDRTWGDVPGVSFVDGAGRFESVPRRPRMADLSLLPSPFLEGVFEPLLAAEPGMRWRTVWETNRGCPFKCTFCDWGSAVAAKLHRFELDRIHAEAEWIAANGIEYLFIADANFGILPRDVEIAEAVVAAGRRHGYPKRVLVQQTKNATERAYQTMKTIADAGMAAEANISIQSTAPAVLEAIKRQNISLESYGELQRRFVRDGIATFVDLIVGLPGETVLSFKESISNVVEGGQHHRVQFHNLSILPNAEMGDPAYQAEYGLETVTSPIINNHGSPDPLDDGIDEIQQLVVATRSMPREDWLEARTFAWLTSLYHMSHVLLMPIVVAWQVSGRRFWEVVEALVRADPVQAPVLGGLRSFCLEFAARIQEGGGEYVFSEDWLDSYWTVDEYLLIRLCVEGALPGLYAEASEALAPLLPASAEDGVEPRRLLEDAVRLNRARFRAPLADGPAVVDCEYDVHTYCEAVLLGKEARPTRGAVRYVIEHKRRRDLDAWLRELVRDRSEDKLAPVVADGTTEALDGAEPGSRPLRVHGAVARAERP